MREDFLARLKENPYDQVTRLVYANWLEENDFCEEALLQREWNPTKQRMAEKYMGAVANAASGPQWKTYDENQRSYMSEVVHFDVQRVLNEAAEFLRTGEPLVFYGSMGLQFGESEAQEFWMHFEVLTGIPVPDRFRDLDFTTCSC